MFKLAFLIVTAVLLLPEPSENQSRASDEASMKHTFNVSSTEKLSALYSVYDDLSQFCSRNQETCITGSAVLNNAVGELRGIIGSNSDNGTSSVSETTINTTDEIAAN